jgi:hypothetical protein
MLLALQKAMISGSSDAGVASVQGGVELSDFKHP